MDTLTSATVQNSIENDLSGEGIKEGEKRMTLVVGMKADGAIILAADKRGATPTWQYLDDREKLYIFNNIAIGVSGKGDMCPAIFQACQETLNKEWPSVDSQVATLSNDLKKLYKTWFSSTPIKKRPDIHIMVAGFNNKQPNKEAVIYDLDSQLEWVPNLAQDSPVFLGYSQYAYYFRVSLYRPNIPKEMAIFLSVRMIKETALLYSSVSEKVDVIEIMPESKPRQLTKEEVGAALAANDVFNRDIYDLLSRVNISPIPHT